MRPNAEVEPRALILGGNANTLAFASSLRPERNMVTARLVPLAMTPIGSVVGDTWQNVQIAAVSLLDWIDQTFPSSDERSFVAPMHDVDLLARTRWHAEPPEVLDEAIVLNIEDCPADVGEALAHPPEAIVQCATCRRLCVRDHFRWGDRQLCAWDYHKTVFGKRGPWRNGPYEARHFETLPTGAYVAPPLLEELGVDVILGLHGVDEASAHAAINLLMENDANRPHLAVRSPDGFTLLREREA
ncbi:MAG TPA: hypothetical protein VIG32_00950 [Candidatus Baltobacteraceae bacterium]|jgi:hypothetical protein